MALLSIGDVVGNYGAVKHRNSMMDNIYDVFYQGHSSAARNAYHWVGSITRPIKATVLLEKPKATVTPDRTIC